MGTPNKLNLTLIFLPQKGWIFTPNKLNFTPNKLNFTPNKLNYTPNKLIFYPKKDGFLLQIN